MGYPYASTLFGIVGSQKPVRRVSVDVESILANCVAIKLRQHCYRIELSEKKIGFLRDYPRKRVSEMANIFDSPPAKKLCKSLMR